MITEHYWQNTDMRKMTLTTIIINEVIKQQFSAWEALCEVVCGSMYGKLRLPDNQGLLTTFSDLPCWSLFPRKWYRIPDSMFFSQPLCVSFFFWKYYFWRANIVFFPVSVPIVEPLMHFYSEFVLKQARNRQQKIKIFLYQLDNWKEHKHLASLLSEKLYFELLYQFLMFKLWFISCTYLETTINLFY